MNIPVRLIAFFALLSGVIAVITVGCGLNDDDPPLASESPAAQQASSAEASGQTSGGGVSESSTPGTPTPESESPAQEPTAQPEKSTPADAGSVTTDEPPDDRPAEVELTPLPTSNLIAYNTLDGQIKITDPDGSLTRTISPTDEFFAWPVWSPAMTHIAFSGTTMQPNGTEALSLFVYSLENDDTRVVYTNEPGAGPILAGMPHYPFWSPDGRQLTFMASVRLGLTLFVADAESDSDASVVLRNAPLYASWSPDSRHLLVHGGVDHYLVEMRSAAITITNLGVRAVSYRAPTWSPSDSQMIFVSDEATAGRGLYASDTATLDLRLLEETPGEAAFLWSPDGELLAVAHSEFAGGLLYNGIRFFSRHGVPQPMRVDEPVLAFFWSPDGKRLAYVTAGETEGLTRWMVLNVEDGERWVVADFIPSGAQSTVFRFFDQFANSHSPWSPDSNSLVFSGELHSEGVSASLGRQPSPGIIVANAGPIPASDTIAPGFLAVWSPR